MPLPPPKLQGTIGDVAIRPSVCLSHTPRTKKGAFQAYVYYRTPIGNGGNPMLEIEPAGRTALTLKRLHCLDP